MRYLDATKTETNEQPYTVEDGVILDADAKPNRRRRFGILRDSYNQTREQNRAEELAWAARSGPVYTVRSPRKEGE